jgi:N-carbamoylputrescine amidase
LSYQAGRDVRIFSSEGIGFGVQLCYEAHFPEISTVMALKGADILFFPHASPRGTPEEKCQSWLRHLPGRAFDNAIFVVACNQVGKTREGFTFPGVTVALNPVGHLMESYCGNREEMLIVDFKKSELEAVRNHRMKYFLPHRRPELYRDICNYSG